MRGLPAACSTCKADQRSGHDHVRPGQRARHDAAKPSNSAGVSLNTFTGGSVLSAQRIQIAADTDYVGPASADRNHFRPVRHRAVDLRSGNNNAGSMLEAYGADRTIVNPLYLKPVGSNNATSTLGFGGQYNLTFTRPMDLMPLQRQQRNPLVQRHHAAGHACPGRRLRHVLRQPVGDRHQLDRQDRRRHLDPRRSEHAGGFGNNAVQLDGGVLQVAADSAIGSAGSTIKMHGGALQVNGTFATTRTLALSAGSDIDVTSGNTFTLSNATTGTTPCRRPTPARSCSPRTPTPRTPWTWAAPRS